MTVWAVAAMVVLAGIAQARSRDRLTGFNGIAFGTKFTVAKDLLGSSFKADHDPTNHAIPILLGPAQLYGEPVEVNYYFGKADRLTRVYASGGMKRTAADGSDNTQTCESMWNTMLSGLVNQYGAPDSHDSDLANSTIPTADATFKFADGHEIDASLMGCMLIYSYTSDAQSAQ